MTKMENIKKKSDAELVELVQTSRKTVQSERFKDVFSRKAGTIRAAKKDAARALTELNHRRRNNVTS
jgi:ribosomal protein L29